MYLLKKRKKKNPTIEKGKLLLHFTILGARTTSPPGAKWDQLVEVC
jgi:hypothetical protein